MGPNPINVLVYAGLGSSTEAVRHCLYTLRQLLSPNYAVSTFSAETLLKEPWAPSCALLVFPGGGDVGYCKILNGKGNLIIKDYVSRGGFYLGFCAGGYYGSTRCEFEVGDKDLEVIGDRELAFFPGICRGSAFKGFQYNSEVGTRAAELDVERKAFPLSRTSLPNQFRSYFNGGSVFVDAEKFKNEGIEILASYAEPISVEYGRGKAAAVVYCKIKAGGAILTGPHPEFAAMNLSRHAKGMSPSVINALEKDDVSRTAFMRACLLKLGLKVADVDEKAQPLSAIHLSSTDSNNISELLKSCNQIMTVESGQRYIEAEKNKFRLVDQSNAVTLEEKGSLEEGFSTLEIGTSDEHDTNDLTDDGTMILITHTTGRPRSADTPLFNHDMYFRQLEHLQYTRSTRQAQHSKHRFGRHLLYGEVVTSTSTILEQNSTLTSCLPQGTTFTATTQIAGRGRGTNVWVSAAGTLHFSTIIRHPLLLNATAPVVFVQYIAAIAVAEGIKNYAHFGDTDEAQEGRSYKNLPVRLKWPNDIYALDPSTNNTEGDPVAYTKIGGILVNSSYLDGEYTLIVGIGLNVSNSAGPTTSLRLLLAHLEASAKMKSPEFTLESLLASILTSFEHLYDIFCTSGWAGRLEELYYLYWLHSGQIVVIETENGLRGRIKGVTRDWGLLLVEEVEDGQDLETSEHEARNSGKGEKEVRGTGRMFALQTDSNSFDFFKGLLKRKV